MIKNIHISPEKIEEISNLSKAKAFLGKEFLMWLWYRLEAEGGDFLLNSAQGKLKLRLWIDDRLSLRDDAAQESSSTFKGGDPAKSMEAAVALRSGKTVHDLKLGLEIDSLGPFTVQLACDSSGSSSLTPKSLQLPRELPDEIDQSQPVALRLMLIQKFTLAFDALFQTFMDQRVNPDWEKKELQKMRKWLQSRPVDLDSVLH